ncbi:hypothetical protein HN51_030257 [Arachis hypogaea]|uniref:Dof-type domain-containing protein n=2 Tax=Arachis TaxID=3817 RepID=A0A445BBV5_ARAHY|nr:dof zinc finger protein DOF1.5-like [Arachis duranensis]XP_025621869.1 dof zinc finger protein DOF1.5 [Arachis hypogaea]QHO14723.1 Cyclic dof factor [Arachis hypogaea]RYR36162.1 hypothetical protein Ahy_A10g051192 [Arachis hypogaea]
MAQVQENHQGIKLFGATITLDGGDSKEGNKKEEDQTVEKKPDKIIACPRCKSMETKFCYFNNYNVNQPRHFCKGCQRYWTAGGALRNVPVGAGRRKANKLPCRAAVSDGACLYDETSDDVHKFGLEEGLLLDKWNDVAVPHGDFRQLFPAKRRRSASAPHQGQ